MIKNRLFTCYLALAGSFSYNIQTICSDKPTPSRSAFSLGNLLTFGGLAAGTTFLAVNKCINMKHERLCKDIDNKFCIDDEPCTINKNMLVIAPGSWNSNDDPNEYLSIIEKMRNSWFCSISVRSRIEHYYLPGIIAARRKQILQRFAVISSTSSLNNSAPTPTLEMSDLIQELKMLKDKLKGQAEKPDAFMKMNKKNEISELNAALDGARSLLADARRKQDLINRASNFSFRNKNFLAALTHRMPIGALDENRLSHQVKPEDDVD